LRQFISGDLRRISAAWRDDLDFETFVDDLMTGFADPSQPGLASTVAITDGGVSADFPDASRPPDPGPLPVRVQGDPASVWTNLKSRKGEWA
jgi:hypothetical protein